MKINVIRQNTPKYRRVAIIRRVNFLVTFGSIGLFAAAVIYITFQFVYLGFRQSSLARSVVALTTTYNKRAREAAEYLVIKDIVVTVDDITEKSFNYKDFLNGVLSLLPPTAILSAVDFAAEGVVVAGVRLSSLNDYDLLTRNIADAAGGSDFLFSEVAEKMLVRDDTGSYLATLELKIK